MKPLILVSSLTGNTRLLALALGDALGADVCAAKDAPETIEPGRPVLLGFWCDRGIAPEDIREAAEKLTNRDIGCFATMGGDPTTPKALAWMEKTSQALVGDTRGNRLKATFLCRGRIDPLLFERMSAMMGGVTPEREARRRASETHPDRLDMLEAVERFRTHFGTPNTQSEQTL